MGWGELQVPVAKVADVTMTKLDAPNGSVLLLRTSAVPGQFPAELAAQLHAATGLLVFVLDSGVQLDVGDIGATIVQLLDPLSYSDACDVIESVVGALDHRGDEDSGIVGSAR